MTLFRIFFRGGIFLKLTRHTVDWKVLVNLEVEAFFEFIKQYISFLFSNRYESIVVFIPDVHNELIIVDLCAFGEGFDRPNINCALKLYKID